MASRSTASDAPGRTDRLLLVLVAAVSSAYCLTTARILGATFDEPFYLEAGLDAWRRGTFKELLSAGVMPLPAHLQTLPLYLRELAAGRPLSVASDLSSMLPVARSVTLVFWLILLFYGMRLARAVGGPWAGRLAVTVIALEPNFLAHAGLATTDIALAAFLVMFACVYREGRDQPWSRRIALPAAVFGLALASKASALTFGPMVIAAIEIERWRLGHRPSSPRDGAMVFVAGTMLAVLYCGPGGEPSFQGMLSRMPVDHMLRPALAWFGSLPLSPNAFYAFWFQADHNNTGQPTFLLGVENARSLWFYVPVLPAIKFPIATLALMLWALVSHRPRLRLVLGLAGVVAVLMLMVRVQTGIRFLLPLMVFLVVGVASRVVTGIAALPAARRPLAISGLSLLLLWMAVGGARAWPDPLRHVNELWGGPEHGYRVVSDSNYDWGQGLPELAQWQQSHGEPTLIWYFGTDTRFPQLRRFDPRRDSVDKAQPRARYLAVSSSLLYGGYLTADGPGRDLMLRLRRQMPETRTRTFFVFNADVIYESDAAGS
ncbi:MAG: hypothetical protein AB7N29_17005 [Vicinamibacterales bacterium]